MSFKKEERVITKINDFVLTIVSNNNNKTLLKKYFPRVYEKEVRNLIYDFFETIRINYRRSETKDLFIKKSTNEIYEIQIDEVNFPILIYDNHYNLKLKSVNPLTKGGEIIGWIPAKTKFE